MRKALVVVGLLLGLLGSAQGQTQVVCNQGSSKVPCTQPLLTAYIPNLAASIITSGTLSAARLPTGIDAANIGAGAVSNTEFGYLDGVTSAIQTQIAGLQTLNANLTALAALSGTGILARTGTNTFALRTFASGTGTTVTNGDGVSGNPSINVTYGTGSNTATQGNDTRLPPAPSGAGKILYDNGSAYVALAAGTAGQLLGSNGPAAPSWVSAPGAPVTIALFANGGAGSWYPTEYAGPGSLVLGSGGTPLTLALWCAPVAGTLRDLTVQGASATSANSTFTIASSPGGNSPIFSTSTVTCTANTGNTFCRDNTHTVALSAFDCVAPVMTASAIWATGGASVNAVFIPN
jgi:hypothetical protein